MRYALFGLIFVVVGWSARASDTDFDVLSYDVRLQPDFVAQTISGVEVVRFKSLAAGLDRISFTANTLAITASIDGAEMVASEVAGDRLVFRLPKAMRKGQVARLLISFKGAAPKGLVFNGETVRSTYAVCDYMICDYERPGDKARVAFRIVLPAVKKGERRAGITWRRLDENPLGAVEFYSDSGMTAIAPGHLVGFDFTRDGIETEIWESDRALSAYLLGFAVGKFQWIELGPELPRLSVLTTAATSERAAKMFANTRQMLSFFEAKAGVPFPGVSYTQVLVEDSEAQEAASHSTIGIEEISPILTDPHEDWVIAHELAHQWWGNAVTCADWRELWLNEGLTVFMVAAYKEQRWGRADYERELALANKRWAAAKEQGFDVPLSWSGTYPSLKLKRAMAYAKAVVFLDALRRELGDEAFWRAISRYTRTNWDRTVTARDLQRAMEGASGRDLSVMFATWVFGAQ